MTEKLPAFEAAMDKWNEAVDERETAIDMLCTGASVFVFVMSNAGYYEQIPSTQLTLRTIV